MHILNKLSNILLAPLAQLASTPEILRMRAEMAYWRKRLDELEASVEARLAAMKQEFYAELKKLELRVEEAEKRNKMLELRLQAIEQGLRKLPGIQSEIQLSDSKIGLA